MDTLKTVLYVIALLFGLGLAVFAGIQLFNSTFGGRWEGYLPKLTRLAMSLIP